MSEAERCGINDQEPPMTECPSCGSKNIKISKKGNAYCADLCWVEKQPSEEELAEANDLKWHYTTK